MNDESLLHQIPYFEYSVINQIAHQHAGQLGARLRAIIVFGEIKTSEQSHDIDLLEVVENWAEKDRVAEFRHNGSLPIHGTLRLWFVTPVEFEEGPSIAEADMRDWVQHLMERVHKGYEVVYQVPAGYARNVLERTASISTLTAPGTGILAMTDPFQLPSARK